MSSLHITERTKPIRSLNASEWFYTTLGYRGLLGSVSVTSRYTKPLSKLELIRALRPVILENPWLLANVFTESMEANPEDCYWKYIDEVDLNDVVKFINVTNVHDEDPKSHLDNSTVNKLISHNFSINTVNGLLWRIVVVNETELCFIFDHGIFDGMSGQIFQEFLLESLRKWENFPLKHEEITTIGKFDLPEMVTHVNNPAAFLPYSGSISYLLKTVFLPVIPKFLRPHYLRYTPLPSPLPKKRQNSPIPVKLNLDPVKFTLVNLTHEETKNIINACKKNNSTVTAFINIAIVEAISNITKEDTLLHDTPVNVRRLISQDNPALNNLNPKHVLGFFTSIIDSYYHKDFSHTFWDKVKENTEDIKKKTNKKYLMTYTLPCLFSSFIFNSYKAATSMAVSNRESSLTVSNLGFHKVDYKQESKFNVERMTFFTYSQYAGVLVDCVSTNNNNSPVMTVYIQAGPNSLSNIQLQELRRQFKETITNPSILMLRRESESSSNGSLSKSEDISISVY